MKKKETIRSLWMPTAGMLSGARRVAMLLLTTLLLTMTAQTAWADDGDIIYVSIAGSDENDGQSDLTPLATISRAVDVATGGETIFIMNGEYSESSAIPLTKSLSFVGESQDGVRITGTANSLFSAIQDNTASGIVNNQGTIDLEANYWGSNTLPEGITASTWVVEDNGEYTLNDGSSLDKAIPVPTEPFVLPEGTIYVSSSGNDENDGESEETAIATLAHAVDIAKARENKTSTVYVLNGEYTTDAINIGDDEGVSLSIIGQEKGKVTIHGAGAYIFDVYGDNLDWSFKNLDFEGINSTDRTSAALVLYSEGGNFTVDNCNFKNINSKLGAIAIGNDKNEEIENDNGNTNITNCIIENVTGCAFSTAILTVNGDGTYTLDNVEIKDCKLDENVASSTTSSYLRSVIYVNTYEADVTISNSKIHNNSGPMMSLIESRSKLTIVNTTISDNVVNTSANEATGGDNLIWASNDAADINISQCTITGNTIAKSGKGLFYNQWGSMNVEYSDISRNIVDDFIGSTGTITANNNWWGTNDQPDTKVDKWVIMNVNITDDSNLDVDKEVTIAIDFNHVKTSSGEIEELTGGEIPKEIPKESYTVEATAQNGEITPSSVVVKNGEVENQTFEVTNITDVITFACDGAQAEITLEGVEPYRGIIYVATTGDDNNEGSIDAPVATVGKAVELALANGGSGEIIINEGTYVGYGYHITGDVTITGNGQVILDANTEGRFFYMEDGDAADKITLSNLTLTNAKGEGAAVNSLAKELILDKVTVDNNNASKFLIQSKGKLTVENSSVTKSKAGDVIRQTGNGDILIQNSVFKDNIATNTSDIAVINLGNAAGNLVIEDSKFINNTARQGVIKGNYNYNIKVTGTEFTGNTNTNSYGGAIYTSAGTLDITDCVFANNKAARSGGAIYVGYRTTATIDKSIFVDNTANTMNDEYYGDAIYDGNKLTVSNSVLLTNSNNYLIYSDGEDNVPLAQNCWWGTNDDPSSLNGVGYYEDDDWDKHDCPKVDVSNWVTMDASFSPAFAQAGDEATITATFSNDNLPDGIKVTFTSSSGKLNCDVLTKNAQASTTYTIDKDDVTLVATSTNAVVEMPIATNIVTQDNFYSYFDEYGRLLDAVTSDELIFQGEFSGSDIVDYIVLERSITINGDNAVLNNMGFVIAADEITLNNMSLVANGELGSLIFVNDCDDVTLNNISVTYNAPSKVEAKAIFADGAENFALVNSEIIFTGADPGSNYYRGLEVSNCDAAKIDNNTITATLPAVPIDWEFSGSVIIPQFLVLAVDIQGGDKVEFTNNIVTVNTNGDVGDWYPTIDAVMIQSAENILIKGNKITHIDNTTEDDARYYYSLDIYSTTGTVEANDIIVNTTTTAGDNRAGSAFPIQLTGPFTVTVKDNNLTGISKGSIAGIYATNWSDESNLTVENNNIDVTGYATTDNNALVAGIEAEINVLKAYNNTIAVKNTADYDDDNKVIGVGIGSSSFYGDYTSADIKDNNMIVDGKYAVYYEKAKNTNVTGNALCAHELFGDDAVNIEDGDNNTVENNILGYVMPKTGESTYDIPANVSSFKVYDDGGKGRIYSPGCDGTLTLTAPSGYVLQLSGNITTEKDVDYLTVYDGSSNQADILIGPVSSSASGELTDIPTVTSTGQSITLHFCSDNSVSDNSEYDGLDLTVSLISTATLFAADATNKWMTWCDKYAYVKPKGVTVYTVSSVATDKVTLAEVSGDVIPAYTPVLLYREAAGEDAVTATFSAEGTAPTSGYDSSSGIVEANLSDNVTLYGNSGDEPYASGSDNNIFAISDLSDTQSYVLLDGQFVLVDNDEGISAHRCWLNVTKSTTNGARLLSINTDSESTGIEATNFTNSANSSGAWYGIDGRKLDGKPTKKGLYIYNGKKQVIK